MADKLILNAGVNGMSDFERLGKSLKNIKTSATGSLGILSKKMTEKRKYYKEAKFVCLF